MEEDKELAGAMKTSIYRAERQQLTDRNAALFVHCSSSW
jgi:hypothetical protein